MNSSLDPFALSFDSIRVGPTARTETPETEIAPTLADLDHGASPPITPLLFEHEELPDAAMPQGPGFYLLDDASGRFTIDRDTGVVTLVHDHLMALEAGAIHPVHIKVIEHSGASYDLRFRLRMTGRVPQIAGSEDNDGLASLAAAPLLDLMSPIERAVATAPIHTCVWSSFAAAHESHGMLQRLGSEREIYGALLDPPSGPGYFGQPGQLSLEATLPRPAKAGALWLL